ncbi:MAG: isoprenylcysteine carboxylmethyltransferase family protein [Pseudomonadota bacterium]
MSIRPSLLDTAIPPPVVMLLAGAAMWAVAHGSPGFAHALPLRTPLAILVGIVGLLCNLLPKLRFGRVGTTVNPMRPQSTRHLVVDGLHRYSRNPMYVGQVLLLVAWGIFLGNGPAMMLPLLFALYITRFQIVPEERALAAVFGDAYAAYRNRVRRWL